MGKIVLTLVGSQVLIFSLDEIKRLRELGILGTLIGTLPKFPQQNVFLSKPLLLSINECLWLIEKGHGVLVDGKSFNTDLKAYGSEHQIDSKPFIDNRVVIRDEYHRPENEDHLTEISKKSQVNVKTYLSRNLSSERQLREQLKEYQAFKTLKELGYFTSPGLKFGGQFVCYPGDPLRYHSHLVVNVKNSFYTNDLIVGGRLATGVKKLWVIMDCNAENYNSNESDHDLWLTLATHSSKCAFSVEWAGFG